jgi:hypothetical protein
MEFSGLNLTTSARRAISRLSHDGPSAKQSGLWLAGKEDWLVPTRGERFFS